MPPRLVITLDRDEMGALNTLADRELRTARDQLRHILRQALQERGLLAETATPPIIDTPPQDTIDTPPAMVGSHAYG